MLPLLDCHRVVWCGPHTGSLGWLHDRIEHWCREGQGSKQVLQFVVADGIEDARQIVLNGSQRLILACENRWDYQDELLRHLNHEAPDVPLAIALSDWWLGWRRTGIGHFGLMPGLCLPWFRWWDGWVSWLEGSCASMFGPFPGSLPLSGSLNARRAPRTDLEPNNPRSGSLTVDAVQHRPGSAIVIGGCALTVQTWLRRLQTDVSATTKVEHTTVGNCIFDDHLPDVLDGPERPDWILWDDTRLSTSRGYDANLSHAIRELNELTMRYPDSQLWVSWCQPLWAVVRKLQAANLSFELVAKPYFGNLSSAALGRT